MSIAACHRRARSAVMLVAIVALTSLIVSVGCGSARRGEPVGPPVNPDDPKVVAGQQVFMTHCYQCHPGGAAGLGPAINDKPLPGALIKLQVRNGLGAMPSFGEGHISDPKLDALVSYLQTLRTHGG